MPRPRLTPEEWEIAQDAIAQRRAQRITEDNKVGGRIRGAQVANAHSYANSQEHLEHMSQDQGPGWNTRKTTSSPS